MGGRSGGPSGQTRTGTQDGDLQSGTMAELGALEAMAVQGAQVAMAELGALEAMADGLRGLGLGPLGPAPTAGTHTTPPPQNFPGEVRGYQEPSGAKQTGQTGQGSPPGPDRQDSTKQECPPGPDRQDRTGQDSPQEPEALLGWLGG